MSTSSCPSGPVPPCPRTGGTGYVEEPSAKRRTGNRMNTLVEEGRRSHPFVTEAGRVDAGPRSGASEAREASDAVGRAGTFAAAAEALPPRELIPRAKRLLGSVRSLSNVEERRTGEWVSQKRSWRMARGRSTAADARRGFWPVGWRARLFAWSPAAPDPGPEVRGLRGLFAYGLLRACERST